MNYLDFLLHCSYILLVLQASASKTAPELDYPVDRFFVTPHNHAIELFLSNDRPMQYWQHIPPLRHRYLSKNESFGTDSNQNSVNRKSVSLQQLPTFEQISEDESTSANSAREAMTQVLGKLKCSSQYDSNSAKTRPTTSRGRNTATVTPHRPDLFENVSNDMSIISEERSSLTSRSDEGKPTLKHASNVRWQRYSDSNVSNSVVTGTKNSFHNSLSSSLLNHHSSLVDTKRSLSQVELDLMTLETEAQIKAVEDLLESSDSEIEENYNGVLSTKNASILPTAVYSVCLPNAIPQVNSRNVKDCSRSNITGSALPSSVATTEKPSSNKDSLVTCLSSEKVHFVSEDSVYCDNWTSPLSSKISHEDNSNVSNDEANKQRRKSHDNACQDVIFSSHSVQAQKHLDLDEGGDIGPYGCIVTFESRSNSLDDVGSPRALEDALVSLTSTSDLEGFAAIRTLDAGQQTGQLFTAVSGNGCPTFSVNSERYSNKLKINYSEFSSDKNISADSGNIEILLKPGHRATEISYSLNSEELVDPSPKVEEKCYREREKKVSDKLVFREVVEARSPNYLVAEGEEIDECENAMENYGEESQAISDNEYRNFVFDSSSDADHEDIPLNLRGVNSDDDLIVPQRNKPAHSTDLVIVHRHQDANMQQEPPVLVQLPSSCSSRSSTHDRSRKRSSFVDTSKKYDTLKPEEKSKTLTSSEVMDTTIDEDMDSEVNIFTPSDTSHPPNNSGTSSVTPEANVLAMISPSKINYLQANATVYDGRERQCEHKFVSGAKCKHGENINRSNGLVDGDRNIYNKSRSASNSRTSHKRRIRKRDIMGSAHVKRHRSQFSNGSSTNRDEDNNTKTDSRRKGYYSINNSPKYKHALLDSPDCTRRNTRNKSNGSSTSVRLRDNSNSDTSPTSNESNSKRCTVPYESTSSSTDFNTNAHSPCRRKLFCSHPRCRDLCQAKPSSNATMLQNQPKTMKRSMKLGNLHQICDSVRSDNVKYANISQRSVALQTSARLNYDSKGTTTSQVNEAASVRQVEATTQTIMFPILPNKLPSPWKTGDISSRISVTKNKDHIRRIVNEVRVEIDRCSSTGELESKIYSPDTTLTTELSNLSHNFQRLRHVEATLSGSVRKKVVPFKSPSSAVNVNTDNTSHHVRSHHNTTSEPSYLRSNSQFHHLRPHSASINETRRPLSSLPPSPGLQRRNFYHSQYNMDVRDGNLLSATSEDVSQRRKSFADVRSYRHIDNDCEAFSPTVPISSNRNNSVCSGYLRKFTSFEPYTTRVYLDPIKGSIIEDFRPYHTNSNITLNRTYSLDFTDALFPSSKTFDLGKKDFYDGQYHPVTRAFSHANLHSRPMDAGLRPHSSSFRSIDPPMRASGYETRAATTLHALRTRLKDLVTVGSAEYS